MRVKPILFLSLLAAALVAPARAAEDFHWQGKVAGGGAIEVKGINGGIRASAASGDQVEVTAVKRARHGNPDEVEIKVVEHPGGVTICALYPGAGECVPGEGGHRGEHSHSHGITGGHDNDTEVDFTVRVPAAVRFIGRTVNGGVEAKALRGDAEAYSVNGGIWVEAAGHAIGQTVNGGIQASLGRADWTGGLDFKTVNGGITLELPANTGAELKAETVNGDITSDFPLTVQGSLSKRRVTATIGSGGRQLTLSTVNGGIHLQKAP